MSLYPTVRRAWIPHPREVQDHPLRSWGDKSLGRHSSTLLVDTDPALEEEVTGIGRYHEIQDFVTDHMDQSDTLVIGVVVIHCIYHSEDPFRRLEHHVVGLVDWVALECSMVVVVGNAALLGYTLDIVHCHLAH